MVDLTPNSQSQIYMKCVKNCAENWYLHLGSKGANVINGSLSHICNILCNHRLLFCFQTWKLNNLRRLLCTSMQGNVIFRWNHIYIAFSKRSVRKAERNSESKARYWRRSDKAREVWVGLGTEYYATRPKPPRFFSLTVLSRFVLLRERVGRASFLQWMHHMCKFGKYDPLNIAFVR